MWALDKRKENENEKEKEKKKKKKKKRETAFGYGSFTTNAVTLPFSQISPRRPFRGKVLRETDSRKALFGVWRKTQRTPVSTQTASKTIAMGAPFAGGLPQAFLMKLIASYNTYTYAQGFSPPKKKRQDSHAAKTGGM